MLEKKKTANLISIGAKDELEANEVEVDENDAAAEASSRSWATPPLRAPNLASLFLSSTYLRKANAKP